MAGQAVDEDQRMELAQGSIKVSLLLPLSSTLLGVIGPANHSALVAHTCIA